MQTRRQARRREQEPLNGKVEKTQEESYRFSLFPVLNGNRGAWKTLLSYPRVGSVAGHSLSVMPFILVGLHTPRC